MVIPIDNERAMVATMLPFLVGPNVDAFEMLRPFLWNEAIVDVKPLVLFPLKVVSSLFLAAVRFAMKVMIAAHQAQVRKHLHQGTMV